MCIKNARLIAEKLGFADYVTAYGSHFGKEDQKSQIDLIFERSDKVYTLCEIKYYDKPVETSVIPEVRRKCELFQLPRGYTLETALISRHGPDRSLKSADFFNHYLSAKELLTS
jgi:hypothetical protein